MTLSSNFIILALALVLNLTVYCECALRRNPNLRPITSVELTPIEDDK